MPSPECNPCQNCRWLHEEIKTLIRLWLRDEVLRKFNGTSRDSLIYIQIADAMKSHGFQKSAQQVRLKIKNLKREYKQTLNKRRLSGGKARITFRYFYDLDQYLRRSPPTVSAPTVIYMDQEIATAKDEESMETGGPGEDVKRFAYESYPGGVVSSRHHENTLRNEIFCSDEESTDCSAVVTTKSSDSANSDHALYTAKASTKDEDEDADVSSLSIKKAKENKTRLNSMDEILNRVLDTTLEKFMEFERQIEEKNRVETKSFRNEVLALERKKLEESVTQTLQNDRLICLMETLLSSTTQ